MTPGQGVYELSESELRQYRILGAAAAGAVLFLGLLRGASEHTGVDPYSWRVAIAAYLLVLVAASYRVGGRTLVYLAYSAVTAITAWLVFLSIANDFSTDYTLTFVIVVAAVGLLFRRLEHLIVYCAATYVAIVVAVTLVGNPAVDPGLLVAQLGLLFVFASVVQQLRHRANAGLEASEERYALALAGANDGLWDWDRATNRVHYSARWKGQLGEAAGAVGDTLEEWWGRVHPDDVERVRAAVDDHMRGRMPHLKMEHRMRHRDGEYRWVLTRGLAVRDAMGSVTRMAGSQTDITDRYRSEQALRESQRMLYTLMSNLPGMAYRCRNDRSWTLEFVSEGAYQLTGYHPADLVGNATVSMGDLIQPADRERVWSEVQTALGQRRPFQLEYRLVTASGDERWVWEQGEGVLDDDGHVTVLEGFITDITERKRAEARLVHDALHDLLTGLPNRALFLDRLDQTIKHARRRRNYGFAVLFLDLDRFKLINDSFGHLAGDELLNAVANRLRGLLRPEDTVARLGGDEFAILLAELADAEDAKLVAERVRGVLEPSFRIVQRELFVSATIGIALGCPLYDSPEDMLRDADTAMYRAKSHGRGRYEVFNVEMHAQAVAELQMENDLRRALDRGELVLEYQPIFRLPGRDLYAFEALLRWRHPDRGLLVPDDFLAVAEDTGLIVPIGWWALAEACDRLRSWRERSPSASDVVMSINLSGKQFAQPDLVERIESVLVESGLPPSAIQIEITESAIMVDPRRAAGMLERLRSRGVRIALDDFGTGYSSLSYLHQFPVDFLKIDRAFVQGLGKGKGKEPPRLIQTMISLAAGLALEVVGEGVETEAQLAALSGLGCDYAQGYFFSLPLDGEGAARLLGAAEPVAPV